MRRRLAWLTPVLLTCQTQRAVAIVAGQDGRNSGRRHRKASNTASRLQRNASSSAGRPATLCRRTPGPTPQPFRLRARQPKSNEADAPVSARLPRLRAAMTRTKAAPGVGPVAVEAKMDFCEGVLGALARPVAENMGNVACQRTLGTAGGDSEGSFRFPSGWPVCGNRLHARGVPGVADRVDGAGTRCRLDCELTPCEPVRPACAKRARRGACRISFPLSARNCASAPGGARDWVSNGDMRGGFGMVAWPAEYRNSGVMSFLVGPDGVILERDLGMQTPTVAAGITEFAPDTNWRPVK